MKPQAFFLPAAPGRAGQRFCLFHRWAGAEARGVVLYVHPFAEEMNKTRRMAALQARALAAAGFGVLQIDLLGCGDSSGDFGDAAWEDWTLDVVEGAGWLRRQSPAPLWLWGLRAGCLLAAEAAGRLDQACNFLFWQAVPNGQQPLQQFLRLKGAAEMQSGNAKRVMDDLRRSLAQGGGVEIAGYSVSAALAGGLEASALRPPAHAGRLEWFEISARADGDLSAAGAKETARWQQASFAVRRHRVQGPAFWQTSEIEEAPHLLAATVAALSEPALP